MKLDRRTGTFAIAAAGVALVTVLVALLRDSEADPPTGYETQDTLRHAGVRLWNVLKQRDYQPPDGFSYREDEWGNAVDVVVDKCRLKDVPDHLLQGQQFTDPPDEMGYLIIVTSKGPDGQLDTNDDLIHWRVNGVEDGQLKGQGEVYKEEVWPDLAAYVNRIRGAGSTGGG